MKILPIFLPYLLFLSQQEEIEAGSHEIHSKEILTQLTSDWQENFAKEDEPATYTPENFREKTVDALKIEHVLNPEEYLTTPELIKRNGYPAESHTVETKDGYLLMLHRIPRGKKYPEGFVPRRTVLLHHGILSSSADWVINGPGQSLAYILADAGYDVWMGNARGNTYSRGHVSLNPDSLDYWNFSWHEIGTRDLPAVIDYIDVHKFTKDKIHYVGHSMGTTTLFVLLSSRPEYNQRIRAGYAMAPVAYMSGIKTPAKFAAPIANIIQRVLYNFGIYKLLPQNHKFRWIVQNLCVKNEFQMNFCRNLLFEIFGYDPPQFILDRLPVILGHAPAGSSIKCFVHYAQLIVERTKFQQFDYGRRGNLQEYGSKVPPEYPLKNITVPISLFVSKNDRLSAMVDSKRLYNQLNNPQEFYIVPLEMFNHVDFIWAKDAPKLVYNKILKLIENNQ